VESQSEIKLPRQVFSPKLKSKTEQDKTVEAKSEWIFLAGYF
jgi:hypothetical protein